MDTETTKIGEHVGEAMARTAVRIQGALQHLRPVTESEDPEHRRRLETILRYRGTTTKGFLARQGLLLVKIPAVTWPVTAIVECACGKCPLPGTPS